MPPRITVRHIMTADPVSVPPETSIQQVLRLMNRLRIGAVLVGTDGLLEGIFTERDFLRHTAEASPGWRDQPVSAWMTRQPHTISPDCGWEDAVAHMEQHRVRHLPVIENGRFIGIVSARQLMARRNEHLKRMVTERTEELQRLYDEVTARDAELRQTMVVAGRLQTRLLLPASPPKWEELRWGIHYVPLDPLGGDYYDFALPNDHQIGLLIADASGHSIAAAMVAIMARFAFAEITRHTVAPAEVLRFMNRRLQGLTDERFVTAFYGVLDRRTREFRFANAGHQPALWVRPSLQRIQEITSRGLMLGIVPDAQYEEQAIQLEWGDRLCLFTDGLVESRNARHEAFGLERLKRALLEQSQQPAEQAVEGVVQRLDQFRGTLPARDDITIVLPELILHEGRSDM
ncbi:MAG: SpoIIE family protein phosphatase [Gemmataceae bacterium]|nr:SpoIIE family protein phosphatase [Gemmataceae bacterium]